LTIEAQEELIGKTNTRSFIKMKGVYVVAEPGALYPSTGASLHIRVGMEQLDNYFEIERLLFCKPLKQYVSKPDIADAHDRTIKRKKSAIRKFFSWMILLISNHHNFFIYYRLLRKKRPSFIYERAGYLNYNGVIIAHMLKIPHFYEVNGIAAHDHEKYFPGVCNKWAFRFEKGAYKATDFGFYVGGINRYFDIPKGKFLIVQNGIEEVFAEKFKYRANKVGDKINIAFIGNPMDHHRLDILIQSLNHLQQPSAFRINFIGPGLESLKGQLPHDLESRFFGQMSYQQIEKVMGDFNVAVIPFAKDYFSHVKVFMYAAAKLVVMLPDTVNFKNIFTQDEAIFFKNGDASDIVSKLDELLSYFPSDYGEAIYNKVIQNFTWEKIYERISAEILNRCQ
jgi:glycosyltransferase involved in cell wall biosynthesis